LTNRPRSFEPRKLKEPWSDAVDSQRSRETHPQGDDARIARLWAKVANERLEKTGDEGRAIREANSVVARQQNELN
jgi:hypothetical protein